MDRRLIRIDVPPVQAGIAAALRRAFNAAPSRADPSNDEFKALLSRIH